jgi:hypothetical protein
VLGAAVACACGWAWAGAARADPPPPDDDDADAPAIRAVGESPDPSSLTAPAPLGAIGDPRDGTSGLHLDPLLRLSPESVGVAREAHQSIWAIGAHTAVAVEGRWWDTDAGVPVRGWRAGVRAAHDFSWARLSAMAAYEHVDTDLGRATFRDLGVSLTHLHRFSRWRTAWFGLSLANRTWLGGRPPPGESNGTALTLSIGTTFR